MLVGLAAWKETMLRGAAFLLAFGAAHAFMPTSRVHRALRTTRGGAEQPRTALRATTVATPAKLEDATKWLENIDVFIFDCDGVIWKGDSLIPGVEKTLEMLRALKKRLFFVTVGRSRARARHFCVSGCLRVSLTRLVLSALRRTTRRSRAKGAAAAREKEREGRERRP